MDITLVISRLTLTPIRLKLSLFVGIGWMVAFEEQDSACLFTSNKGTPQALQSDPNAPCGIDGRIICNN